MKLTDDFFIADISFFSRIEAEMEHHYNVLEQPDQVIEKPELDAPNQQPVRLVILTAKPMTPVYQKMLKKMGVNTSSGAPPIDWTSPDTSRLPSITQYLHCTCHMAICLVDQSIWTDANLSRIQKFQGAKFYDHIGWDGISAKGNNARYDETWQEDSIKNIESVELLGKTLLPDIKVNEFFEKLIANWVYGPIWWNCQDFAARLGCLLTAETSLEFLRNLLLSLRALFYREIVSHRDKKLRAAFAKSCSIGMKIGVGTFALAIIAPPVAPIGAGAFVGCWLTSAAIGINGLAWEGVDGRRFRLWQKNMRELGDKFPVLRELHEGLI